jgi:hypothetical protein
MRERVVPKRDARKSWLTSGVTPQPDESCDGGCQIALIQINWASSADGLNVRSGSGVTWRRR